MSKLIIEIELAEDSWFMQDGKIVVDFGQGVTLRTPAPKWVERIDKAVIQIVMEVEGHPHAQPSEAPIERVHETPTNGGLKERKDGGSSESGSGGL